MSIFALSTNPVEAGQDTDERLKVVEFDENDEGVEDALVTMSGGGFSTKICAGESASKTDPNNPAPLYSENITMVSLDQERNLTVRPMYLHLIPVDHAGENWSGGGVFDSRHQFIILSTGVEQTSAKINTTDSIVVIYVHNWSVQARDGHDEWPDEVGNYTAIMGIKLSSPTTPEWRDEDDPGWGWNHNVGGYLQTLEFNLGVIEVISIGDDCFPPDPDIDEWVILIYWIGAPLGLFLLVAVAFSAFSSLQTESHPILDIGIQEKNRSRYISNSVRGEVFIRDQGKCVNCGINENLEFDHVIPFSKGGSNSAANIQLLCSSCNQQKSDKI